MKYILNEEIIGIYKVFIVHVDEYFIDAKNAEVAEYVNTSKECKESRI